ncbi:MAG: tetratricopeptide repeat protein [Cognaticolwellia sp.]
MLNLKSGKAGRLAVVALLLNLSACSLSGGSDESSLEQTSLEQNSPEQLKKIAKSLVDETTLANTQAGTDASTGQVGAEQSSTALIKVQSSEYLRAQQQAKLAIPDDVKALYQSAVALMKQQNWPEAREKFSQVAKLQPELAGSYVNLALIAQKTQQLPLAKKHLERALQVNALNPYAHNLMGLLARQQGDFDLAEKSYLAALKSLPNFADAHLNLAILAELYRGKFALAREHYQAYLMLNPEDKQVQRWLAGLSLKLAQTESGA